jgi:GntR family transcriptional regulator
MSLTSDSEPVMLLTSHEPLSISEGTPVMLPERRPLAGRGVRDRMASIVVPAIAASCCTSSP